ncbi:MAG TPA: hypothetical protein VGW75_05255 [Solirubrobacteraceae bacterium]|jgi:hypothetical protein|nr:hypothetical protein [Solirubrobacteraceae bacterium]
MRRTRRAALAAAALATMGTAAAPGQAMAASESCTAPTTTAVDGYVLNSFVRLTSQRDPNDPKTTWVCYRAYDVRVGDRGGRIDVRDATVSPTLPSADNEGTACTTTAPNAFPGPRPLLGGQVGDPDEPPYAPFLVDAYLAPFQLWGCLQAGPVSARVKVATSGIAAPAVTTSQDAPGMPLPVQKPGPPGYPSSKCLENYWHVRDVNMRIGDAHVWAYHWPESETRRAICLRVQRAGLQPIGYRIYVDTNNAPGVTPVVEESSVDTAPCTSTIAAVTQPVEVRLSSSPRGANPASICVEVGAVKRRITVGTSGDLALPYPGIVKDPDSV